MRTILMIASFLAVCQIGCSKVAEQDKTLITSMIDDLLKPNWDPNKIMKKYLDMDRKGSTLSMDIIREGQDTLLHYYAQRLKDAHINSKELIIDTYSNLPGKYKNMNLDKNWEKDVIVAHKPDYSYMDCFL